MEMLAYFSGGSMDTDLPLFAAFVPILISVAAVLAGCAFYSAMKDRGENGEPLRTAFMDNGFSMACLNTLGILCTFVLPITVYGYCSLGTLNLHDSLVISLMMLSAGIGGALFLLAEDFRRFSLRRTSNWRRKFRDTRRSRS